MTAEIDGDFAIYINGTGICIPSVWGGRSRTFVSIVEHERRLGLTEAGAAPRGEGTGTSRYTVSGS